MSKPFTDMKKIIILVSALFTAFGYGGGMPVIDVVAIASQKQADHLDYLEQLIHEGNQVKTIAQLVEQIRLIDSYLERFGDPGKIRDLAGAEELLRQLDAVPVLKIEKPAIPDADEVFRPFDDGASNGIKKEILVDGSAAGNHDGSVYAPEVLERRLTADYLKVRESVLDRRRKLREGISGVSRQLQAATTASEVQKLAGVLSALQSELQSVDQELVIAANDLSVRVAANATEKAIQAKGTVERERAALRVGTLKASERFQLFTTPISFSQP